MPPLLVTLDSSVLLHDPARTKAATRALERLIRSGEVSLHLSTIVIQETTANLLEPIVKARNEANKAVRELTRRIPERVGAKGLKAYSKGIAAGLTSLDTQVKTDFTSWLTSLGVETLPITATHGDSVFDAYFTGKKPFQNSRSRDHLPDAFILSAIRDLRQRGPAVAAVIADNRLREALADLLPNNLFAYLDEFVASPTVQPAMGRATARTNLDILAALQRLRSTVVASIEAQYIDALYGQTIVGDIPGDNNEGTITSVGSLNDLKIDVANWDYLGGGLVRLPFSFTTEVYADSAIFISDYYTMPDEDRAHLGISSLNEHYVSAEGTYDAVVTGYLSLDLKEEIARGVLSRQKMQALLRKAIVTIDEIDTISTADAD